MLRDTAALNDAFATPDIKRRYNRRMFGTIADRYDFFTRFMSFGQDQSWKIELMNMMNVQPGWRVLDLACGTGDLAFEAARRGATGVGLDLTTRMVELANAKEKAAPTGRATFMVGDMTALPVPSSSFNLVTTGYGLRNVPDLKLAITEIYRSLKPGGKFGSLDFDRPEADWVRAIYLGYLDVTGGIVGWLMHRDPDTYRYIPASIRRYPGSRAVGEMLIAAGFINVRVIDVMGGLMAIHVADKPAPNQVS